MVEVYVCPGSVSSNKVLLALEEKKVEYTAHSVNVLAYDHLWPEYVRLNPRCSVPTLIHESKAVLATVAILQYVDATFPTGPPLFPTDDLTAERVVKWVNAAERLPIASLSYHQRSLSRRLVLQRKRHQLNLLKQFAERYPDLRAEYTEKMKEMELFFGTIDDAGQMRQILKELSAVLDMMERELARQGPYLAGKTYTMADVCWTAVLTRLEEVGMAHMWTSGKHPHTVKYIRRMQCRTSFSAAITKYRGMKRAVSVGTGVVAQEIASFFATKTGKVIFLLLLLVLVFLASRVVSQSK